MPLAAAPLQGKNADGTWKTSRSKEYPVLMNKAMAEAMLDQIRRVHRKKPRNWSQQQVHESEQLLQYFKEFMVQYDGYEAETAELRPDFMHHT